MFDPKEGYVASSFQIVSLKISRFAWRSFIFLLVVVMVLFAWTPIAYLVAALLDI